MTDAQTALAKMREALAAGPTPGPWHHCQPFQSVRAERTIHGPVPAQRVDFVSTKTQPVHERIIIPMAGKEAHVRSEDMAFIAACNPENIAALLAEIDRLTRERDEARTERDALAKQGETFRRLVDACKLLSSEAEEYEFDDGMGRGAMLDYWYEFDRKLDAALAQIEQERSGPAKERT